MLTSSFLNILLICMPIGIWAGATGASPNLVFSTVRPSPARLAVGAERGPAASSTCSDSYGKWQSCLALQASAPVCCAQRILYHPSTPTPQNFLALIPLALFLGEVTEDLAVRFGDIIGGLLNATFGNVVEL